MATEASAVTALMDSLKKGDVVLQNAADTALAAEVVKAAAAKGIHAVSIAPGTPNFAEVSGNLKGLGGFATVTPEYAATWRLKRLLSDLPAPTLGISAGADAGAVEMVKVLASGGTLATYSGKLPTEVAYGGSARKPVKWSAFLKEHGVSTKAV